MISVSGKNGALGKMVQETVALLRSEEVQHLIRNTIASGFHVIIDHIAEYFLQNGKNWIPSAGPSSAKETTWEKENGCLDGFRNVNKTEMPMAKLIPILNGQVPVNANSGDVPSDWLQRLILNEKYKALGADVYDKFCRA